MSANVLATSKSHLDRRLHGLTSVKGRRPARARPHRGPPPDDDETDVIDAFSIARLPRIRFGSGSIATVPEVAARYGRRALLVTGAHALLRSPHWPLLQDAFAQRAVTLRRFIVPGEPSPELVDQAVAEYGDEHIDVVIAIGGGSALDAAKAIAGLLRVGRSVMDYLEGVGPELPYEGAAVPLIAAPTTAGTGSEATKNAVLSRQGANGFKKSFRHERLVPQYAVVDPDLLATCPLPVLAANGMDALTQLIESFVSTGANPMTDALGISGLRAARDGLLPLIESGASDPRARQRMAYAAMISGINLAQTGLGSVHGLAAPLGAFYPIPHGAACGTALAVATEINIRALRDREPGSEALDKYAYLGEILAHAQPRRREASCERLVALLHEWTARLQIPRLSVFGLKESDIDRVVAHARGSSMKTNPIVLTDAELRAVVQARL